jgi:hypothetical protein
MAMLTQTYKPNLKHTAYIRKRDEIIERLILRLCMLISTGPMLVGLSILYLMGFQLIPSMLEFLKPTIKFQTSESAKVQLSQAGFRDISILPVPFKDDIRWNSDWITLEARK